MAVVGTLIWAEEEIEKIKDDFSNLEENIDEIIATKRDETSLKELEALEDRLGNIMDIFEIHQVDSRKKEEALELYYSINNAKNFL